MRTSLLWLPLGLLACTGKEVPENEPPTCLIVSPTEGAIYLSGTEVSLLAEITDPEGEYVSVYWTTTAGGAIADGPETSAVLPDGSQIVTVQGLDEHGESCEASVSVVVDEPPTLVILAPTEGQVVASGTSLAFSTQLADPDDDAEELTVEWFDEAGDSLGTSSGSSDGLATVIASLSTPGPQTLTATVSDPAGASASASVSVTVDTAPGSPGVTVTPTAPVTDDDLVASVSTPSVDVDGDAVTYGWLWYKDGALSDASVTDTLPASATSKGEVWTVRAVPNDGVMDGIAGEASATVGNTAPVVVSLTITPDPLRTDDTATGVVEVYDADGDEVSYAWAWTVDGRLGTSIGDSLSAFNFERDQTVGVTAKPSDAESDGLATTTTSIVVNTPPEELVVTATVSPIEGIDDLVCEVTVAAEDDDGDDVTLSFTWTVDGVAWTDGATTTYAGDTVLAEHLLAGEVWTCSVVANDGYEDAVAVTSDSTVRPCAGGDETCPVADCQAVLDEGGSGGDGLYWLDIDGVPVATLCDMTTEGGGWTLTWRSSDDGLDTFTWDARAERDALGDADATGDFRSEAYAAIGFSELLATHEPSGIWATYAPGDGSTLADLLATEPLASSAMIAGDLAVSGTLCATDLYLRIEDATYGGDSYGPTWAVDGWLGCRAMPGVYGGIGPDDSNPTVESSARGFGEALGVNTGTVGAGENFMGIWVR